MAIFEDMDAYADRIPTIKLALHIAQIVFAFILWCLEIAVFRASDAAINGNNGWTFAVCFCSIPAWIYLTMAPRYPRTAKFAVPWAMLTVDAIFTIIWLSAFSTQAAYNTANSCGSVCGISKGIVALGVFVFLFWCATTFLSIYTLKYNEWNNQLPGYGSVQRRKQQAMADPDPDKAAFSMAPHDEEAYAPLGMNDHENDHASVTVPPSHASDPYRAPSPYDAPTHHAPTEMYGGSSSQVGGYGSPAGHAQENPFRQENPFEADTEYQAPGAGRYNPPTAQDEYEDERRPAQFPNANYDRIERFGTG